LEFLECEIYGASSGREALNSIIQVPPDLLLLDLMLPDYSGTELLDALEERNIIIPFVIISAINDTKTAVEMMKRGARDYVQKGPDLFDILPPVVERVLTQIENEDRTLAGADFSDNRDDHIQIESVEFNANFAQFLIETAQAIVLVLDTKGNIIHYNNFLEELSGYKLKEVKSKSWFDLFIPKNEKEIIINKFNKAIAERITQGSINSLQKKSGVLLQVQWYDKLLINKKGDTIGLLAIGHDVTKTLESERALIESEAKYKELFENMSSGVIVYNAIDNGDDYIFKNLNIAAKRIEKIDRESIIGKRLSEFVPKESNKEFYEVFKKVFKIGNPIHYQFTFVKDNKIVGWRDNYIYKLPSGEIVSIFDDATERKNSEEALRESEERYRSFVQNFKGIAYRWTYDFKPIFFHGSVTEITGYTEKDFISGDVKWENIIYPDDAFILKSYSNHVGKTFGFEYDLEYRIIRKDSEIRWVHEFLQNIGDRTGKIIFIQGTIYNITEKKIAEFELKKSREQLRNLASHLETAREEEKKHIAREIHDELGHALTALKLDLAWMQKKKFLRQDVLMKKIHSMTELIESTIRKVRMISSQLRPSVLDHFGLLAAIEWQTKEFQKRTAIRCKLTINITELSLDEYRSISIFRIYQEILTNIARHAEATRVDITLEKIGFELELRVSDNGKGIRQEQLSNLKSFGLLGMNERANSMSGKITISGILGIGTTVTLRIPLN